MRYRPNLYERLLNAVHICANLFVSADSRLWHTKVILRVLSFFDPRELCVIATLSHWAKRVAEDDCLW